jgi:aspartate aminotransferase
MKDRCTSERAKSIVPSITISMASKVRKMKAQGIDVISLETGEPDFDTPKQIIDAGYNAMKEGYTHYTDSRGIPELREAIKNKLWKENKIKVDADEIIVTPGAKYGIFLTMLATINLGDEVLIPNPGWHSFEACVKAAGGIPVGYQFKMDESLLDFETIENKISPRTKLILLNYPSNPTGMTLSLDELKHIADIAEEHDLLILSDEIYEKIVFNDTKHYSIGSIKNKGVLTLNGFSKTYAMTGWRIGYIAGDKEIIDQILKLQQHSVTCACAFAQKAAVSVLLGPQKVVKEMVNEYKRRRDLLVERLNENPGMYCPRPQGTFYVFPDISKIGLPSVELANLLLERAHVSTTPGEAFCSLGKGHLRLSFATSRENIEEALEKMEKVLIHVCR